MKNLWFLFLPIIFISACNNTNDTSQVDNRLNIVLIVSDDHGMDDAGCYGNNAIKTPSLDYLASEGLRFNNAFCTTSSCSASRSVILTGVYNHANGQFGISSFQDV